MNVKLIDFGSSVHQIDQTEWNIEQPDILGTLGYQAIELVLPKYREQKLNEKIDIWFVFLNLLHLLP